VELRTSEVARITGGRLTGPDVTVSGAAIDSRAVGGGELFVPVVAERDGHEFVPAALEAGAAAYLTQRSPDGGTAISVDDTTAALTTLASVTRDRLGGHVVGVTGSVGKTSVKDMLAAVLATRWRTSASVRSFNNELGVPLTVLNAPTDTEALVVEMGARGAGHVKALCGIARPTVGVVTLVAAVHTETFGSVDDVARAKGELVEALPASGVAVLNADDPRVAAMASLAAGRTVTFGAAGDVRAEDVTLDDELRPRFRLVSPWGACEVALGVRGLHMIDNALAAAAAGLVCDVPVDSVGGGLASARLSPWRMDLVRLRSGALVLNDAYNANPTSMAAALRALAAVPARRRVAVLGLMAEIGAASDDEHRAVGRLAQELGVDVVSVGVPVYGGTVVPGSDPLEALDALGSLGEGDVVLLKGSRVAGLERLASALESRS
jgi:UDP-N-acetylmuramoyl-tripeptide--D-alanyl-D-alanine ligase